MNLRYRRMMPRILKARYRGLASSLQEALFKELTTVGKVPYAGTVPQWMVDLCVKEWNRIDAMPKKNWTLKAGSLTNKACVDRISVEFYIEEN